VGEIVPPDGIGHEFLPSIVVVVVIVSAIVGVCVIQSELDVMSEFVRVDEIETAGGEQSGLVEEAKDAVPNHYRILDPSTPTPHPPWRDVASS
jgi:hypothetical protein